MSHLFFQSARPLLFAHRGGGGLAPENTMAAFDHAMTLRVDGFELDVRLSRDGIVVVHHDRELGRTTNLSGMVEQYRADELARADAAVHFRPAAGESPINPFMNQGIGIPTLEAVLARYPGVPAIIELKLNEPELAHAVIDVVRRTRADDRVCLGSFGLRVMRAARERAPHIATSAAREEVRWALYRSWVRWPVAHVPYGGYQIPERSGRTRVVSRRFVDDAHRADLKVQVWTVDDVTTAHRLLEWGVDALISDRPDLVYPAISVPARDAP